MPLGIGICTRSGRVRIPNHRYTTPRLHTRGRLGAEVVRVRTSYFRPRIVGRARARCQLLLLRGVLIRECEAQGARTGGGAGLDWWAGPAGAGGATAPRFVVTPLGTQTASVWVDERRRANLGGWCMRTRSGRVVEEAWVYRGRE